VPEQAAQPDECEYGKQVVENYHGGLFGLINVWSKKDHDSSYPVATYSGQLPLHILVDEVDETGQWVFDAATRAAENYRSSHPLKGHFFPAFIANGELFFHFNAPDPMPAMLHQKKKGNGAILQTGAFYAKWRQFARGVD
jgi:hypothetical protein